MTQTTPVKLHYMRSEPSDGHQSRQHARHVPDRAVNQSQQQSIPDKLMRPLDANGHAAGVTETTP